MKIFVSALFCLASYSVAQAQSFPPGKGGEIMKASCGACHSLDRTTNGSKNKADWKETVDKMIAKGADIDAPDEEILLAYLARYYGEDVIINKASAKDLQEQLDLTPAEAEAIVKAREALPFRTFADLGKVPGLDIKKLEPLKGRFIF